MKPRFLIVMPYLPWGPSWMFYEIPLGIGYISAVLKEAGYEGSIINIAEYNKDYLSQYLAEKMNAVDVILSGGLSAHFNSIKGLFDLAKEVAPRALRIVGGGLVSSEPELATVHSGANVGVSGEGEKCILEIFSKIGEIDKANISIYSAKEFVDMDTLPIPDYEGLVSPTWLDKQHPTGNIYLYPFDKPRALPLVTTRGCPFKCTYCYSPLGRKYRERSVSRSLGDIEYLCSRFNINILNVYDEVMALKPERLQEFCKGIKRFKLKWVTEMRITLATRDNLELLKEAGCYLVNFGIENTNPEILDSMKKGITKEEIEETLELCYQIGISATGNILMMDIAENMRTVDFSLDWLRHNLKYTLTCAPVQAYPGSELYKRYVERKEIDPLDFIKRGCPFPLRPPSFNNGEFVEALNKINRFKLDEDCFPARVVKSERAGVEPRGDVYNITVECPHCNSIVNYGNIIFTTYMATEGSGGKRLRIGCRECNRRFDIRKPRDA